MSTTLLQLQPGTLPTGYCWPATPQEFLNDAFDISSAVFGGTYQVINFGSSTPAAADRDKPWLRTVNGRIEGFYSYSNSYWLRPHSVPASSSIRMLWTGSTSELLTFDGGANEATSASTIQWTGPMWEVDSDFAAVSPMGVGTLATSGTSVVVGTNYGNEQHTLTNAQLPTSIGVQVKKSDGTVLAGQQFQITGTAGDNAQNGDFAGSNSGGQASLVSFTVGGGGEAHSILHPVRGVYFIKRTARVYIRQSA